MNKIVIPKCIYCKNEFLPSGKNQTVCAKKECRKKYNTDRVRKHRLNKKANATLFN